MNVDWIYMGIVFILLFLPVYILGITERRDIEREEKEYLHCQKVIDDAVRKGYFGGKDKKKPNEDKNNGGM